MVAIEALDGAASSEDTILSLENINKRFGSNVTDVVGSDGGGGIGHVRCDIYLVGSGRLGVD